MEVRASLFVCGPICTLNDPYTYMCFWLPGSGLAGPCTNWIKGRGPCAVQYKLELFGIEELVRFQGFLGFRDQGKATV